MSKRGNKEYLQDILECIERMEKYTKNMSYEDFELVQDACIRNIEIMGGATKNLSKEYITEKSEINWSDIAQTRDKVIHYYFGVNLDIIWDIIANELSDLSEKLKLILENL